MSRPLACKEVSKYERKVESNGSVWSKIVRWEDDELEEFVLTN